MIKEDNKQFEYSGEGMKIGIVISQFNFEIGKELLESCTNELKSHKVEHVKIVEAPGALEIPLTVKTLVKSGEFDAIITLGIVIKGETDHYEHVTEQCSRALTNLALKLNIPIIQGVIAAPNKELAENRVHRGKEYAQAAIQIVHVLKNL